MNKIERFRPQTPNFHTPPPPHTHTHTGMASSKIQSYSFVVHHFHVHSHSFSVSQAHIYSLLLFWQFIRTPCPLTCYWLLKVFSKDYDFVGELEAVYSSKVCCANVPQYTVGIVFNGTVYRDQVPPVCRHHHRHRNHYLQAHNSAIRFVSSQNASHFNTLINLLRCILRDSQHQ